MFEKSQEIFTFTLTNNVLTISEDDGVTAIAIKLLSGVGTYKGTKMVNGLDSTPTALVAGGDSVTVSAEQTKYIRSLVIDCSAGVAEIIAR